MTTCSHHAITGLSLRSSFLTNCLPEKPLIQLGDLTNAPYMILLCLIVAAVSQTYMLLPDTYALASSDICRCTLCGAGYALF